MKADDDYQIILTNTLRKIGRNLLNYQRIELLWKSHINISELTTEIVNGTIVITKNNSSSRPQPMGWLAESHRKSLFTEAPDHESGGNIKNTSINTSVRILGDSTLSQARRKEVITLVQERNTLVHLLAEKFDHTSKSDCIRLSEELDEQNARIIKEIEFLNGISDIIKNELQEISKYLESEEFKIDFSQNF